MSAYPNRRRGEVAIGNGQLIRFTVDATERLETAFGADWLAVILSGVSDHRMSVMTACLNIAIAGGEPAHMEGIECVDALQRAIVDAIFLGLHGVTAEEHQKAIKERPSTTDKPGESPSINELAEQHGYAAGLLPDELRHLTLAEIGRLSRCRGEAEWEAIVNGAWLNAQLVTIGAHAPKEFPRSPDILLPPKEVRSQARPDATAVGGFLQLRPRQTCNGRPTDGLSSA